MQIFWNFFNYRTICCSKHGTIVFLSKILHSYLKTFSPWYQDWIKQAVKVLLNNSINLGCNIFIKNPATNDLCGECPHQEVATGSWEMNDTGMYAGDCFIFYLLEKKKVHQYVSFSSVERCFWYTCRDCLIDSEGWKILNF